jgi:hypothetical protein
MGRFGRVPAVLLCLAFSSAPALAQTEPDEDWQGPKGEVRYFRVDPVSRARHPLDWTRGKTEDGAYSFRCSLPGAAASVAFPYGEPLVFAAALEGPPKPEEQRKKRNLERLALKDGKRYATNDYEPLEVTDTGEQVTLFAPYDKKRKKPLLHRVYWFRPIRRLAAGEYALSSGMIMPRLGCDVFASAFRISDVPAAQQTAPARQPAAPSSGPQTPAVPSDMRQLRDAAERGDKAAQQQLGYAYGTGTGVPQDYELAALWFRKAAAQGSMEAQYALATMHRDGLGMLKDDAKAFELFRMSAEQGYPAAQSNLGNAYYTGRGAPVDFVEAHKWLNLGAARLTGDAQKQSAALRDEIGAKLTPAQLADAQRRAREWMEAFEKRRP